MDASHAPEVVPSQEAPQVYYTTKEQQQPILRGEKSHKKKILGLRATTFWLLLVLALVIVAAAVGGGVGGSMAVKNAKKQSSDSSKPSGTPSPTSPTSSSSSSSTSSPTTSGGYVAPTDVILPLPCADATPAITVAGSVYRFNATCGVDHPKNDLLPIVAYSLHDCLAACAKYNSKWGVGGCRGVVFGADLAKFVAVASGNCYLKNETSADAKTDGVISAVLMGTV